MPEMNSYIGTKIVNGHPMSEHVFLRDVKGQVHDVDAKPDRDGYLVIYEDGYRSWSPKQTFENSYRIIRRKEKDLIL